MAPITEDLVQKLQADVARLQKRCDQLESKLTGGPSPAEAMRMILIGPPGAGTSCE